MKCNSLVAALAAVAVLGIAAPVAAQVKLRFGHAHPEADSQHVAAVEFAKKVKERTQGAVEIQIFPSNQLGNDGAMIAGVRSGTIDMETSGNPFFTGMVAKLNALDLPYEFGDTGQLYRELDVRQLPALMLQGAKTSSVVMFLVACAMVSAWLITIANIPQQVVGMLEPFMGNKILLMFMMMVLVVVVGTALDLMPTVLILTPVLMPLVKQAGIDPIYFGVLFIINNAIGLLTPPVGTVLNVVAGVARVGLDRVAWGVWPFLAAQLGLLLLLILFPQLVTVPARWFY